MAMNSASPVFPTYTPSTPGNINTHPNMDICGMLTMLIHKVDMMDSILTQLDEIQTSVTGLTGIVHSFGETISTAEKQLVELEQSRTYDNSMLDDINKRQKEMEEMLTKMQKQEKDQSHREAGMRREITDLRCRSMCGNLMFYKIEEEKEESCESKVIDFIETKLGLDDGVEMKIHSAHRVGAYNKDRINPSWCLFP